LSAAARMQTSTPVELNQRQPDRAGSIRGVLAGQIPRFVHGQRRLQHGIALVLHQENHFEIVLPLILNAGNKRLFHASAAIDELDAGNELRHQLPLGTVENLSRPKR
jgi:hypothetical protein